MIRQRKARAIFGGTMAVGLIFVVAGAAFACTKYYGKITGSGNGTGNGSTTVSGNPDAGFFQWCENPAVFSGTNNATREASWGTKVDATSPSLTITVAPATTCLQGTTGTNRLPGGNYKVAISNGYWDETDEGFATGEEDNCHTLENPPAGVPIGTVIDAAGGPGDGFTVSSTFSGSETYASGVLNPVVADSTASDPSGWNTVCVYWPEGQTIDDADTTYWNPANALNFRSL